MCLKYRPSLLLFYGGLCLVVASFIYLVFYISGLYGIIGSEFSSDWSSFVNRASSVDWCISKNTTVKGYTVHNDTGNSAGPVCTYSSVIVPGDFYPFVRNDSQFEGQLSDISSPRSADNEGVLRFHFHLKHNKSFSTKHSSDVLVPARLIILSSMADLPVQLQKVSDCMPDELEKANISRLVYPCSSEHPKFRIHTQWNIDDEMFLYLEDKEYSLHVMYTSYFLFLSAVAAIIYNVAKSCLSKTKSPFEKVPI